MGVRSQERLSAESVTLTEPGRTSRHYQADKEGRKGLPGSWNSRSDDLEARGCLTLL